jgi:3'-phosphoadenosine 5'-phosphosulfate sulfotransferase (PAPS reductase)/FAD synthetase
MNKVVCWWSGGITSAVACKIALDMFDSVHGTIVSEIIMLDTMNEHPDTYRFKKDCEDWYGQEISMLKHPEYNSIQDVWKKYNSLNVANGAICSSELKRRTREIWQRTTEYDYQVFGFEFDTKEFKRALSLKMNHSKSKPIFPLLMMGLNKEDCIKMVQDAGITVPKMYELGFRNNNCFKTGCVQGGIGYWQKMRDEFPDKFNTMAKMEHELTDRKGKPVTMLKDQSKAAKDSGDVQVFLLKHPDYPNLKELADMKGRPVEPLMECNGFCGTNDLEKPSETWGELNLELE